MTSSLVGSEMCIRDRRRGTATGGEEPRGEGGGGNKAEPEGQGEGVKESCLLYTSDAADDM
eukprot:7352342-Prorocentrum_lima.AAC.1